MVGGFYEFYVSVRGAQELAVQAAAIATASATATAAAVDNAFSADADVDVDGVSAAATTATGAEDVMIPDEVQGEVPEIAISAISNEAVLNGDAGCGAVDESMPMEEEANIANGAAAVTTTAAGDGEVEGVVHEAKRAKLC